MKKHLKLLTVLFAVALLLSLTAVSAFAAQYADTLHKTCSMAVLICDRDAVIASAGVPRREYADKALSEELEELMENRSLYIWREGEEKRSILRDGSGHFLSCVMPILSEGDIIGCVASLMEAENDRHREIMNVDLESKLIQTAAGFLGKQLES